MKVQFKTSILFQHSFVLLNFFITPSRCSQQKCRIIKQYYNECRKGKNSLMQFILLQNQKDQISLQLSSIHLRIILMGTTQSNNLGSSQQRSCQQSNKIQMINWDSEVCDLEEEEMADVSITSKIIKRDYHCLTASKSIWVNQKEIFHSQKNTCDTIILSQQSAVTDQLTSKLLEKVFKNMKKIEHHKKNNSSVTIEPSQFFKVKYSPIQNDFELLDQLGHGSYGKVFKAVSKTSGEFLAIKQLKKEGLSNDNLLNIIKQFDLLRNLDHPNIIKLYSMYSDDKNYYIVTQLCQGGSLLQFILKFEVKDVILRSIIIQILSALNYLHSFNIIHRDIKLQNIVIVDKPQNNKYHTPEIKLIDFGLAEKLNKYQVSTDSYLGTLPYMPPQGLDGVLNTKWDIWSLGVMLYIMVTSSLPYQYDNKEELIVAILDCDIDWGKLKKEGDKDIVDFCKLCLKKMTNCRANASYLLKHIWITKDNQPKLNSTRRKQTIINLTNYQEKNSLVSMVESYVSSTNMNQEERQKVATIFNKIDKNKSGFISYGEFKSFFFQQSESYQEDDLMDIFSRADKNNSNKIQFSEFVTIMQQKPHLFNKESLERAYDFLQKTGKNHLSKTKVIKLLKGAKGQQINNIFNQIDGNEDDQIDKEQFVDYLHNFLSQKTFNL